MKDPKWKSSTGVQTHHAQNRQAGMARRLGPVDCDGPAKSPGARQFRILQQQADRSLQTKAGEALQGQSESSEHVQYLHALQRMADASHPFTASRTREPIPDTFQLVNFRLNSHTVTPIQRVATYGGAAITPAAGAYGASNLKVTDAFKYGVPTAKNTGAWGRAKRIDGDWSGSAPNVYPNSWDRFSQLVSPYTAENVIMGHLINEKIGGVGDSKNIVPMTRSTNAVFSANVEQPIRNWLAAHPRNLVDYKATANYGAGAHANMAKRAAAEHTNAVNVGTGDTQANLRTWVDQYIDATFPSRLDVEAEFGQVDRTGPRVRKKPLLQGSIENNYAPNYAGPSITGRSGKYSGWIYAFSDTINYGGTAANNTGQWGYAKRIDNGHAGTPVGGHRPDDWVKFTTLVGPDAVSEHVQGHLINQGIGGQGVSNNLVPLTNATNSLHSTKVESRIRSWLARAPAKGGGYESIVEYDVTAVYGGADPTLKNDLLAGFDDTNDEVTGNAGIAPGNLAAWVGNYVDATFPGQIDVSVSFMKANGAANYYATRAKTKPALIGHVTNEP